MDGVFLDGINPPKLLGKKARAWGPGDTHRPGRPEDRTPHGGLNWYAVSLAWLEDPKTARFCQQLFSTFFLRLGRRMPASQRGDPGGSSLSRRSFSCLTAALAPGLGRGVGYQVFGQRRTAIRTKNRFRFHLVLPSIR